MKFYKPLFIAALTLSVSFTASAPYAKTDVYSGTHAAAYLAARHAQKHRDWDNAAAYWDIVVKKSPETDEISGIRSRAALTALASGEYDQAVFFAQEGLADHPDELTVFDKMILAAHSYKIGNDPVGKGILDDIDDEAFKQLVVPTIENYLKDSEGSSAERFSTGLKDLSKLFLGEGRKDSTLLFARLAHYLNPESTEIDILLGDTLYSSDDFEGALKYYQNISDDIEQYTRAQLLAARSLRQLKRTDEAITLLTKLNAENPSDDVLFELGDYYRSQKDFENAVNVYSKLLGNYSAEDLPKRYAYAYYLRGISYEHNGQWALAEADFLKALEIFPENPDILNYLGYGWIDQAEKLEEGEEMIRKALKLNPLDGYTTDSLGWALYKKGDYKEAVKYLEKAVELEPYDPIINDHLGDAYWQVKRYQEAKFQWKRAINFIDDSEFEDISLSSLERKLENGLAKDLASATKQE